MEKIVFLPKAFNELRVWAEEDKQTSKNIVIQ